MYSVVSLASFQMLTSPRPVFLTSMQTELFDTLCVTGLMNVSPVKAVPVSVLFLLGYPVLQCKRLLKTPPFRQFCIM